MTDGVDPSGVEYLGAEDIEGPLGGVVGGAEYPRGGEGRITIF